MPLFRRHAVRMGQTKQTQADISEQEVRKLVHELDGEDLNARLKAAHDLAKHLANTERIELLKRVLPDTQVLAALVRLTESSNERSLALELSFALVANLAYVAPSMITDDTSNGFRLAKLVAGTLARHTDGDDDSSGDDNDWHENGGLFSLGDTGSLKTFALCAAYNLRKSPVLLEALGTARGEAALRRICEQGNSQEAKRARATLQCVEAQRAQCKRDVLRRGSSLSRAISKRAGLLTRRASKALSRTGSFFLADEAAARIQAAFRAIKCRRQQRRKAARAATKRYDNFRVKDFRAELATPQIQLPRRRAVGLQDGPATLDARINRLAPLPPIKPQHERDPIPHRRRVMDPALHFEDLAQPTAGAPAHGDCEHVKTPSPVVPDRFLAPQLMPQVPQRHWEGVPLRFY